MDVPATRVRHRRPPQQQRLLSGLLLAGPVVAVVGVLLVRAVLGSDAGRYGLPLDRNPGSPATRALAGAAASAGGPERRALLTIRHQPLATWLTDAVAVAQVPRLVAGAAARHAVPVLVLYRIPGRDCGSFSSSGAAADADEYRSWLRRVLVGLGRHRALVILEPDALAQLDCLDPDAAGTRIRLLHDAVGRIAAQGSWLYVDAGHQGWVPASVMAARLRSVGAERATGLALNVANFGSTEVEVAYGRELVRLTGDRLRLVVDTSRNGGDVEAGDWCNPPGSRLGVRPTVHTDDPLVDAYLWIKTPGASDGSCNGGPAAGLVWPAYARALAGESG